jgi:hypothetical protein
MRLRLSRDEGSTIDKTYIREFMSNPNQICCTGFEIKRVTATAIAGALGSTDYPFKNA